MKRQSILLLTLIPALLMAIAAVLNPPRVLAQPTGGSGADATPMQGPVISGVVTSAATGQPLARVEVEAIPVNNLEDAGGIRSDRTDENGAYQIALEEPGSYYVRFRPRDFGPDDVVSRHLPEYYNDKATLAEAAPVDLQPGQVFTANAALELGGAIEGQILPEAGGPPLDAEVYVDLYTSENSHTPYRTDLAFGAYHFYALPAGAYYLHVRTSGGDYLDEFYSDAYTLAEADAVDVTLGMTQTADVTLAQGAIVRGRITAADSGAPLAGVSVSASLDGAAPTLCDEFTDSRKFARTDARGMYTMTGLITGTYRLQAYPALSNDQKVSVYLSNERQNVQVQVGQPAVADVAVARGGLISGRVTAADTGAALPNVVVTVYSKSTSDGDAVYSYEAQLRTDAGGNYRSSGLPDGVYVLQFKPPPGPAGAPATDYHGEWHSDQADRDDAKAVQVTAPAVTTADEQLARGGRIRGRVIREATGAAEVAALVQVIDQQGQRVDSVYTGSDGAYTTGALAPGSYYLLVQPTGMGGGDPQADALDLPPLSVPAEVRSPSQGGLGFEFYSGAATFAAATPVAVAAGATQPDIDFTLPADGGSITGYVATDRGSLSTLVHLYDATGYLLDSQYTSLDAPGVFEFNWLRPGAYFIEYEGVSVRTGCTTYTPYQGVFYDGKPDLASATPIVVGANSTASGIDALLVAGEAPPSTHTLHLPLVVR
ncbi:MAG: carboxypeptidase regulatory-like domain-containing protein [Anaerolinea sp.]|nr:carboxypeptidase regulatory-like domain-containing protein [Anaerolinea sp.]